MLLWFPWFWRRGEVTRLRKVVSRIEWNRASSVWTRTYLLLKAVFWPVTALVPLYFVWRQYGQQSVPIDNRSTFRQLRELLVFTYWYGGAPIEYYDRKLYDETLAEVAPNFISLFEHKILAKELNGLGALKVRNKCQFERECLKNDLPVLKAICHFGPDSEPISLSDVELPAGDLYLKPSKGKKGIGMERWSFRSESKCWSFDGQDLSAPDFLKYCGGKAEIAPYLLQDAVENHSSLQRFSVGPLVTFRLVTVRRPDSQPVLIAAYCAMPRGQVQTNHEDYGGMVAKVDCETGQLECAFSYTPFVERHRKHPDTQEQIEGAYLDSWAKVVDLALKAHAPFRDVVSIGWDIIYTPDGHYVLEGNTFWGLDPGLFLGQTAYVDICLKLWEKRRTIT